MKIAVTGASGLVGSHLVNYLAYRRYQVVALVRSHTSAESFLENWRQLGVEVVVANVADSKALREGFVGVDVVVHAAGVVDPYGDRQVIYAVNVEGTRNALDAAHTARVKQFVFVSSLSVITGNTDQYNVSEEAPLRKCGESYADSKVDAELLVMSYAYKNDMFVTAVRPGFIYGPQERAWMPRLIDSIKGGKAALIDGGKKQTNVIYVENLNRAIEATFLNPAAYGQVYNLTDGETVTKKQLFDAIADGLNLPRVKRVVPSFIAKPVCLCISSVASLMPLEKQRGLARYSKAAYRLAGLNQGFSIARAEKELGYVNRIPFAKGMAATLDHFRQHNEINRSAAASDDLQALDDSQGHLAGNSQDYLAPHGVQRSDQDSNNVLAIAHKEQVR